jgi:mono/diheme cytochrome c family protein
MMITRIPLSLFAACASLLAVAAAANAADEQTQAQPASPQAAASANAAAPTLDPKKIFVAQCGWCHGSYGMTADKGPRLAGTQMTEQQVVERIRNGKSGYMPSFRQFLNDEQIAVMAKYIKSLKPED